MLDSLTQTAVFNAFRNDGSPTDPSYDKGLIEQIWYDDAETIGVKVKMARDKHHLGGVGLYRTFTSNLLLLVMSGYILTDWL